MSTNLSPVLKLVNLPADVLARTYFKFPSICTPILFNVFVMTLLSYDRGCS